MKEILLLILVVVLALLGSKLFVSGPRLEMAKVENNKLVWE